MWLTDCINLIFQKMIPAEATAISKHIGFEVIFMFKVNGIQLMSKGHRLTSTEVRPEYWFRESATPLSLMT